MCVGGGGDSCVCKDAYRRGNSRSVCKVKGEASYSSVCKVHVVAVLTKGGEPSVEAGEEEVGDEEEDGEEEDEEGLEDDDDDDDADPVSPPIHLAPPTHDMCA